MGDANRRRDLKPKKIRIRSDSEIAGTVIAYKNLYKRDPFLANMMLLCSELSEYIEIPTHDPEKLTVFVKENQDALVKQFVKRFKSIEERAIPVGFLDPPVAAGWAGGMGRA